MAQTDQSIAAPTLTDDDLVVMYLTPRGDKGDRGTKEYNKFIQTLEFKD